MANAIPPPTQRLINCLANISPRTQSRGLKCLALSVSLAFIGAVVTLGLGLGKQLPKNIETPLTLSFTGLIILFGIALVLFSFLDRSIRAPLRPPFNNNMIGLPRLLRIPSIDSGLGSEISLVDSPLNRSRENLQGSRDSGINIII